MSETFYDRLHEAFRITSRWKDKLGRKRAWTMRHLIKELGDDATRHAYKGWIERQPPGDVLHRIADLLGVNARWLSTGEGTPLGGFTDRPLHVINGALRRYRPPGAERMKAIEAEFSSLSGFASWGRLKATSPTVQLLFGNLLARRLECLWQSGDEETPSDPRRRGKIAGELWNAVWDLMRSEQREGSVLGQGEKAPDLINTPEYTDAFIRAIGVEMIRWRTPQEGAQ